MMKLWTKFKIWLLKNQLEHWHVLLDTHKHLTPTQKFEISRDIWSAEGKLKRLQETA